MQKITLDSIFKNARLICDDIYQNISSGRRLAQLALLVFCCSGVYGLSMGAAHSWQQALAASIKVPLLFVLTLLISIPTLHFIGLLLGSRIQIHQSLAVLGLGIANSSVLLFGFASISFFFLITGSSYRFLLLMHVLFFIFSGLAGLVAIKRHFQYLAAKGDDSNRSRNIFLYVWMVMYMFVGTQMAYVLSPFVGRESQFYFFKQEQGNFYSYVWNTALEKYTGELDSSQARKLVHHQSDFIIKALHNRDYNSLARTIDPEQGLKIILHGVPRKNYEGERDIYLQPAEMQEYIEKKQGVVFFRGTELHSSEWIEKRIQVTQLFQNFIYNHDYQSQVSQARFNVFQYGLSHKVSLQKAFPGAIFVSYSFEDASGNWDVLRLVFELNDNDDYFLTGIVRDSSKKIELSDLL